MNNQKQKFLTIKENQTSLITGVTGGIGSEIAKYFIDNGNKVIGLGRKADNLDQSIVKNKNFSFINFNIEENPDFANLARSIPPVDHLVFAHGISIPRPAHMIDTSFMNKKILVNLTSIILFLKDFIRKKRINKGGSIIFLSSISAIAGTKGMCAYSATKSGLDGYMRSLADELSTRDIRVNSIAPYIVKTNIFGPSSSDMIAKRYEDHLLMRVGEPKDIASLALFLISEESKYITGQSIKMSALEDWVR